jgi:hypothetical protein
MVSPFIHLLTTTSQPSRIQIGPAPWMIADPPRVLVTSLVLIFSHGLPRNNPLCHGLVQKQNIEHLLPLLQNYDGLVISFVNWEFLCILHHAYSVTIFSLYIWPLTQSFIPELAILKLIIILSESFLPMVLYMFVMFPL